MMKFYSLCFILLFAGKSCGQTSINTGSLTIQSLSIAPSNPTVNVGGTVTFTCAATYSDGTQGHDVTFQSAWSVSDLTVAFMSGPTGAGNIATGQSIGSTAIKCTDGANDIATTTLTVQAAPLITNPVCTVPPCVLLAGLQGNPYSFTFAAAGGVVPYTWTVSAGSFAACGVSLATSGVLSGTATTGACTPTVLVTDSASKTATVQVSLTIASSSACAAPNYAGPPNYPCGSTSLLNPGQATQMFTSGTPQGIVNTSNGAIAPCAANCMQRVSGDNFDVTWQTGNGAGNGGNILLGGGVGLVNTTNASNGACPANCVSFVSGTNFNSTWTGTITISGAAKTVGTVYSTTLLSITTAPGTQTSVGYGVKGTAFGVSAWNSTTVATLMTAPGTQTGVSYLDHTACKPGTANVSGNGCQNSVAEDLSIPGHISGTNLVTRISDGSTSLHGHGSSGFTMSGGDNDKNFSYPNGTYLYHVIAGGGINVYQLTTAANNVQVVNAGCQALALPNGVTGFSASWLQETKFYYTVGSQIWSNTLTGSGCSLALAAPTMLADLMAAGTCPGVTAFSVISQGILSVSDDDDTFSTDLAPAGQGSADWVFSWSRTKGCATANFKTGQAWAYCASSCTSSTPALGTFPTGSTNCWGSNGSTFHGIHDMQASTDGYAWVSMAIPWTQGGCAGNVAAQAYSVWQMGTLNTQWANAIVGGNNAGGHESVGITHTLTPYFANWNTRTNSNVAAFTNIYTPPTVQDQHLSWPHNHGGTYDDTLPWVGASDTVSTTQLAGCTGAGALISAVYCPIYFSNVIIEVNPNNSAPSSALTFAHTGACGYNQSAPYAQCADNVSDVFGPATAIGVTSPKGDIFCWGSSMWHGLGYDYVEFPRADAFCIYLGHP